MKIAFQIHDEYYIQYAVSITIVDNLIAVQ